MPSTSPSSLYWTLADWQRAYANGAEPSRLISELLESLRDDDPAWITRIDAAMLARRCGALPARPGDAAALPLWGVPFAVKDNIDAAGLPTTCACPAFAYAPEHSAGVVERLERAGAVVIGKTNLDQFATGLVGTRSPYGIVPNAFDARYISGGSSSGSASVVARGIVPFSLGTDTAGSGRVPAGHNNIVGLKPTRGLVSTRGLVPACRTLDCVSVFALDVEDAEAVLEVAAGVDAADPFSRASSPPAKAWPARPTFGIPIAPPWFGDAAAEAVHARALERLSALGATLVPVDFAPLFAVAALLYDGPWVAERYAAIETLMRTHPDALHPVVRSIVEAGASFSAVDAFKGRYRQAELAREAEALLHGLDGLIVPTSPGIVTIAAALAEPIELNSRMGTYTNFVNLLDWSAIALPAGLRSDGLPAGITVIAPAWHEPQLLAFGRAWQRAMPWRRGASDLPLPVPEASAKTDVARPGNVTLAVVGAHLSGMPLNAQLVERGATLLGATCTAPAYRLFALAGTTPPKPGLVRDTTGAKIVVELWAIPIEHYGSFVALVPSPLAIGTLELEDGRRVQGFVCEGWAIHGALDITAHGGWRAYLQSRQESSAPG